MKTCELTDAALDWAVARAWYGDDYDMSIPLFDDGLVFAPSTNWAHGGPIIEREKLDVFCSGAVWDASTGDRHPNVVASGPTPLIAAMRCFVASKLGDEVEEWV